MSVPAQDFPKLMEAPASKIFAVLVDLYGREIADKVAKEVIKPGVGQKVDWPKW
ncbi:hypothetical protein [Sinorhizobium meliloti]|uniref:hypothetical protein n=1 Tax=Rhizobium meliloti TaxID=382 RepID=UPI0013E3529E|nr:hypothetical protein [Sinorhizobium meliloti]